MESTSNANGKQVLWGSVSMGAKEVESSTRCMGCWISPCYGPFLHGRRFETYEQFISLIFKFFLDCSKLQITETVDTESVVKRAHLCMFWRLALS
jgi:hypothetical protein